MMKKNKGFTLNELIIAIAILVILTGLLAPQLLKYIERSRHAACIHDMEVLASEYMVEVMADSGRSGDDSIQKLSRIVAGHGGNLKSEYDIYGYYTGICKSGGEYQCELWDDLGGLEIKCSRHGELSLDIVTLKNRLEGIQIEIKGFPYNNLKAYFAKQAELDSEAKSTDSAYGGYASFAAAVTEQLNKQGIYVRDKTWKMYSSGSRYELYLAKKKITSEDAGQWVECSKYDIARETIVRGSVQVEIKHVNGSAFPVLKMDSFREAKAL